MYQQTVASMQKLTVASRDLILSGPRYRVLVAHAFSTPAANAAGQGMMFNPRTNTRARVAMAAFLAERLEGKL